MRRGVIHEFRTQLAFALGMQQGDFDRAGSQERTIQREDLFRVWETASISVGTRLGSSYPMVYPVETGPATFYWLTKFFGVRSRTMIMKISPLNSRIWSPFEANLRNLCKSWLLSTLDKSAGNDGSDAQPESICRQRWDDPLSRELL